MANPYAKKTSASAPPPAEKTEEKTIELQTLEVTRPRRSTDTTGTTGTGNRTGLRDGTTRPRSHHVVLETIPSRPKLNVVEPARIMVESAPENEPTLFENAYNSDSEERIEWQIALIFCALAISAAIFFDLI